MKTRQRASEVYKTIYMLARSSIALAIPVYLLHQAGREAIAAGETINPGIMTLMSMGMVLTLTLILISIFRFRD